MAHNLNEVNGKVAFVNAGVSQKAWHGLGQHFDQQITTRQAIEQGGLNYGVERTQVFAEVGGQKIALPYYSNYRTDINDIFDGIVTDRYQILQNVEAFDFFDSFLIEEGNEAIITTAGALGKGETIFITAKLPEYIRIGNSEDVIENFLLLTNSHDVGSPVQVMFTPVRVVCNNTLNAALRGNKGKITFRHTNSVKEKLNSVKSIMQLTNTTTKLVGELFNDLAKTKMHIPMRDFVLRVLNPDGGRELTALEKDGLSTRLINQANEILEYNETSETQMMFPHMRGTKFGALNAITGFYQNVKSFKTLDGKFSSIFMDNGLVKNQTDKALQILLS